MGTYTLFFMGKPKTNVFLFFQIGQTKNFMQKQIGWQEGSVFSGLSLNYAPFISTQMFTGPIKSYQ